MRIYEDRHADPDDLAAKDGTEVGEVIVRSPKSGYAYVNQPEEQAARFHDGWLYIGDLATWDAEEYVTIVGRKDDMIISGGENVHPTQVEAVLTEHPRSPPPPSSGSPTSTGASASSPTSSPRAMRRWTQPPARPTATATRCWPRYKRPRAYRFVTELPMTATGKKMHFQLREQVKRDAADGRLEMP